MDPRWTARLRAQQTSVEARLGRVGPGRTPVWSQATGGRGRRAIRPISREARLQTSASYRNRTRRGRSPGAVRGASRPSPAQRAVGLSFGTFGSAWLLSNDQAPPVCYALGRDRPAPLSIWVAVTSSDSPDLPAARAIWSAAAAALMVGSVAILCGRWFRAPASAFAPAGHARPGRRSPRPAARHPPSLGGAAPRCAPERRRERGSARAGH